MSDVLRIEDLRVSFATDGGPVTAVDGLDLSVAGGEVLALVGESGSGKTVVAKSIFASLPGTATVSGRVLLGAGDGSVPDDVLTAPRARLQQIRGSHAAMVFQEPSSALNPVFPIGWQIGEGLRAHGMTSRVERRARAIEMLATVGIPDPDRRVDDYPHQLSGGQKQRVIIAMALVLNARLIVADEPTTALDVTVQAEILDLLHRCRTEFGSAILLITHNLGVVADLADRVAVMHRGRLVEQATTADLFEAPQHSYTRRLLGSVPELSSGRATASIEAPTDRPTQGPTQPRPSDDTAPPAPEPAVLAQGLIVEYPGRAGRKAFRAVDRIDLRIEPGEVLGLVGESGSGKTTIGRAIAGLTAVSGGSLSVLGHRTDGGGRGRRARAAQLRLTRGRIGFVFQDPATSFNPLLTIGACLAEPFVVHRRDLAASAVREQVAQLLESVQLPAGFADRYPHELSGGQRQRASLARALALRPDLLIADEPTSALDVSVQAQILALFRKLQQERGFATLFISHDLAVVQLLADRVSILHHGVVVETGPADRVLSAPEHPYTQRLISSVPVPDPVHQAERRTERTERTERTLDAAAG